MTDEAIRVAVLRPTELSFVAEFVLAIQSPLTSALDILQSEQKRFMGMLIPTIICLKRKLSEVRLSVKLNCYSVNLRSPLEHWDSF